MKLYILCDAATGYELKSEPFKGKLGNSRLTILALYEQDYCLDIEKPTQYTKITLPQSYVTLCGEKTLNPWERV